VISRRNASERLEARAAAPPTTLRIGKPNDAFEQEADRVARDIASEGDATLNWSLAKVSTGAPLQRRCACGSSRGQGECEECKQKKLQRKSVETAGPATAPPVVHEVLRSPGQAFDQRTRAYFEPRFGHDFSKVRIHTDALAAESARAVNARAYTVGSDVVFGAGQFAPMTNSGRQLLTHELTHVLQQSNTRANVLRRAAIHTGRILDEGTCKDLVAGSKFVCCDPKNGAERKGKTKDVDGTDCPSQKFTPIFACDNKCSKALERGCSDSDNWMTLPKSRFANKKCGEDLVVCANGKSTHAYVRDHSDKESWEVSRAVPAALGVKPDISDAAVYGDETDSDFKKDKRCGAAPAPKKTEETQK